MLFFHFVCILKFLRSSVLIIRILNRLQSSSQLSCVQEMFHMIYPGVIFDGCRVHMISFLPHVFLILNVHIAGASRFQ